MKFSDLLSFDWDKSSPSAQSSTFLVQRADSRVHILVFSPIKPQLLIDFHLLHLYLHHLLNGMRPNNVRAPLRARGRGLTSLSDCIDLIGACREKKVAEERGEL